MIISSIRFDSAKEKGCWFYSGFDGLKFESNSRNIHPRKSLGNRDCFVTTLLLQNDVIQIELDEIEFEAPYFYKSEAGLVLSDDLYELVSFINKIGFSIEIDRQGASELLVYGNSITGRTAYKYIKKLSVQDVVTGLDVSRKGFIFENEKYCDIDEEANEVIQNIKNFYLAEKTFVGDKPVLIGLSGGLDSRVAAYYLKNNDYSVVPFFVGKEKNSVGIKTYDAAISYQLAKGMNLKQPIFLDPTLEPVNERETREVTLALESGSNFFNNVGGCDFLGDYEFLANGSMGGELFGACLQGLKKNASVEELKSYMISAVTMLPQYSGERNILKKILVHSSIIKGQRYSNEQKILDIKASVGSYLDDYIDSWLAKKESKYTPRQIFQVFLYEKFARGHRRGFFYGFNGDKTTLPTFMRPSLISRMLNWDDALFDGKIVQKTVMSTLQGIAGVRSQNIYDRTTGNMSNISWLLRTGERVVRGGGMDYQAFSKNRDLNSLQLDLVNPSLHKYILDSPTMREGVLKIAKSIADK